ncbi:hypothetical protein JKG47_21195 [Acidithiobacillus sp. MC6.1]|uniref:hypothetical protein n=1 Tax=Acidithiobacillus ferrivorans TaxID=160808 RepID=UPI001146A12D|nr:hypothetical protein [Acidithiobacillus ferrivorans]MBN6742956.1 hypothetical protein [Acidithiobacillus sp. MC6.1]
MEAPRFDPAQISLEHGMNTVPPGVAEGLDLFRLAGDVLGVAVLDVAIGRGDVLACRLVVG